MGINIDFQLAEGLKLMEKRLKKSEQPDLFAFVV
jgi:hypothetical protein